MKYKTTLKEIKNSYNTIIDVKCCSMQTLLSYQNAFAYYANAYGWRCDFFDIDDICICVGYKTISKNVKSNYSLIEKYEKKAREIRSDNKIGYKDEIRQVNKLLKEFVKEYTK